MPSQALIEPESEGANAPEKSLYERDLYEKSRSCVTSIRAERIEAEGVLSDGPGLKSRREEAVERAYRRDRVHAAGETHLPEKAFPTTCPYTPDEIRSRPFEWPEA